jgi:hypothetical protein
MILQQMRRRREASLRLPPLSSGVRDPWCDSDTEPLTENQINAWIATVRHLRAQGLTPILPRGVLL